MNLRNRMANAGREMLVLMLTAIVALGWAGATCWRAASAVREEHQTEAEWRALMPVLAGTQGSLRTRDDILLAAGEIRGWETSRLLLGHALQAAERARPESMRWKRVVIQETYSSEPAAEGVAYPVRVRTGRLVFGGIIRGNRADIDLKAFIDALSRPENFGRSFGAIRYPALERTSQALDAPEGYHFTLESHTLARPIDQRFSP